MAKMHIDAKVDHTFFFFIAVLKLVHLKHVNFYMHFFFLNLAPWYLCPVQNNTVFQLTTMCRYLLVSHVFNKTCFKQNVHHYC